MDLLHRSHSARVLEGTPVTRNVVGIGDAETLRGVELHIVSKQVKTGLYTRIDWLVQSSVHRIVCTKGEEHEIIPRIQHVRILGTVTREEF
jgi:hypothetical protein